MNSINWNHMSELGLIKRINAEILHPLGLSISRDMDSGISYEIFLADDGIWVYPERMSIEKLSYEEVQEKIKEFIK